MMSLEFHIKEFSNNLKIFRQLFDVPERNMILWKPTDASWCMLEIVCHLHDEEIEDFRQRLHFVLESKDGLPPGIDPPAWVKDRAYIRQDYNERVSAFIEERNKSISWLMGLENPALENAYIHPKLGRLDGHHFLNNWLAHDQLHIRQLIKLRYDYLKHKSGRDLNYAGNWK